MARRRSPSSSSADAPLRQRPFLAGPDEGDLEPHEVVEARRHLRFLARQRDALRIRWSAQEDLLLGGTRAPERRGVMKHLLGKVDRVAVDKALARIKDPRRRTDLLGGVVRFSTDVGVLITYLESLTDSASRQAAAGAFSLASARMDFGELSSARFQRVLALIPELFDGDQRIQVVFGLLHNEGFASGFQAVSGELPRELRDSLLPLAAAYESIVLGGKGGGRSDQGAALLLNLSPDALRSFPTPVRVRLLDRAVDRLADRAAADRAASVLLESLKPDSEDFRRLAVARAGALLAQGAEPRAAALLRRLKGGGATDPAIDSLLGAMKAPRFGPFALGRPGRWGKSGAIPTGGGGGAGGAARGGRRRRRRGRGPKPGAPGADAGVQIEAADGAGDGAVEGGSAPEGATAPEAPPAPPEAKPIPECSPLQPAFWLAEQRPVWLRVGAAVPLFDTGVAGLLPALASGSERGQPWQAFAALGEPPRWDGLKGPARVRIALQALQVLDTLAALGWRLPDARSHRFVVARGPWLLLHDLSGATPAEPTEARKGHSGAAFGICREVFRGVEGMPDRLERILSRRGSRVSQLKTALLWAAEDSA